MMERTKDHFQEEAHVFDETIVRLIPYYDHMLEALVSTLPFSSLQFSPHNKLYVLDLGCGTGTVTARILERYPDAHVTCLDMASNMIAMAKQKLSAYSMDESQFICADFSNWNPAVKYDAIVSSLALHHLPDDDAKQAFFAKVFDSLASGGIFVNADVVLSGDTALREMYLRKWREFMLKAVSAEEVDEKWFPSYRREDRPAILLDQLEWLKAVGFESTDVIWKYYNFAVYSGKKAEK